MYRAVHKLRIHDLHEHGSVDQVPHRCGNPPKCVNDVIGQCKRSDVQTGDKENLRCEVDASAEGKQCHHDDISLHHNEASPKARSAIEPQEAAGELPSIAPRKENAGTSVCQMPGEGCEIYVLPEPMLRTGARVFSQVFKISCTFSAR
jgi:hypothetical protein